MSQEKPLVIRYRTAGLAIYARNRVQVLQGRYGYFLIFSSFKDDSSLVRPILKHGVLEILRQGMR